MKVRFFNPGKSYLKIRNDVLAEIDRVLSEGKLILQDDVAIFEEKFARVVGTKYAVGVASGTDALILSLKAAGVKPGDEVVTSSYTFRATVEAIHHVGGVVKLYDRDGLINFSEKTKAFIPVYIAGEIPEAVEEVINYCRTHGIAVIEDACQAITAAPVRGLTACYSFYPAKILGCYGDGGAIATNDKALYEELKIMRNHYKGDWSKYGYNSRLDNLQAAVLNIKIQYLDNDIARRKEIAMKYNASLVGVGFMKERDVYQDYIISVADAEALQSHLAYLGIETMRNGYPFPSDLEKGPVTASYEEHSLRLPCNPDLTDEEVQAVIDGVNSYGK